MTSIRRHLTVALLLTFGLLLGTGGAAIYIWARVSLYREFDAALRVKVHTLAAFIKPTHEGVDFEFMRRLQPGPSTPATPSWYEVFDVQGNSLARPPGQAAGTLARRSGASGEIVFWNQALPDGTTGRAAGLRFIAQPLPRERRSPHPDSTPSLPTQPLPSAVELVLVIAEPLRDLQAELQALATMILGAGGLTLLATAGLIPLVLRRGLVPLRRLGEQAQEMDATSLTARFPMTPLAAELEPIASRLNDLLGRLQESFERERRFSADLAHELRTPIAALRTTAEVALKWGESSDPQSFQTVLDLAQQMEALVTRLLALARSEQRALPIHPEPVPVAAVVENLWQPLAHRAGARGLVTRFEVPASASLHTDAALLRGILTNLLANAVDYASPGTEVKLDYTSRDGHFELRLTNGVNDLAPDDLPRLFDRLWRKDKSRHDATHAGLGLPLARSFARLLGMELNASMNRERQLSLVLDGPVELSTNR